MANKEEKIKQIIGFIKAHPDSLASRTILRRFESSDYELGEEAISQLENNMRMVRTDDTEIDLCYDMIK